MSRMICADVTRKALITERVTIEWPDDYGEPTDENVLKAFQDDRISDEYGIDMDVERILSHEAVTVFDVEEDS